MKEIEGVLWDARGNAYAELGNFQGEKQIMKLRVSTESAGQEFVAKYNLEEDVGRLAF